MVEKLLVLTPSISGSWREYAVRNGQQRWGYRYVADLRKSRAELPVILYIGGLHDHKYAASGPVNKVEVVGVAKLGLRRTIEILERIIPDLSQAKMYRIDLAVDVTGTKVWDLAETCSVQHAQNFRIFRKKGVVSYYPQNSKRRTIVIYNKGYQLGLQQPPGQELTRFEIQLSGSGVPFKKVRNIHRYAKTDLLTGVQFRKVVSVPRTRMGLRFLAAYGLRSMIKRWGQQAAAKRLGPSYWAYAQTLLRQANPKEVPDIESLLRKSVTDWLRR